MSKSLSLKVSRLLLLTLLYTNSCLAKSNIHYKIKYLNSIDNTCLSVNIKLAASASGIHVIRYPHNIKNTKASSNGNLTIKDTQDPYIKKIIHSPNHSINLSYDYCLNNEKQNIDFPIIEPKFFHMVADAFLAFPESSGNIKWDIEIDFTEMPEKFITATNYSAKGKNHRIKATIDDFRTSTLVGGEINIDTFKLDNQPIYVISTGEWNLFQNKLIYHLKNIVRTHRNFWIDQDFPYYIIVLIKQYDVKDEDKMLLGFHETNSATLLIPDGQQEKLPKVLWILSHELFHAWLGMKMKIPLPQGDLQWFFEGFNDYYGLLLNLRGKIITLQNYIKLYNMLLKHYFLLPMKNANKSNLINNFNVRNDYALLAQLQGHFLASELAAKTKTKPNLASMDELMRNIFKDFKKRGDVFLTADHLEAAFNQHFGEEWQSQKNSLDQGKIIVPSANALGPCVELETIEVEKPDFGFDVIKLAESNTVQGLKLNSNAYRAGIREGQEVVNYFLSYNDADDPAEIVIKENDSNRTINFYPEKTTASVPQYKLNQEKFSKNKQLCLSYFE